MTMFAPYDRVEIATDRFAEEGAHRGAIGFVIERWPDGSLEVEVMNSDGSTAAQFVAQAAELRLAPHDGHDATRRQ
jgi:hypothetical protein